MTLEVQHPDATIFWQSADLLTEGEQSQVHCADL